MQPKLFKIQKFYEKNVRALWVDTQKLAFFRKRGGEPMFILSQKKIQNIIFLFQKLNI